MNQLSKDVIIIICVGLGVLCMVVALILFLCIRQWLRRRSRANMYRRVDLKPPDISIAMVDNLKFVDEKQETATKDEDYSDSVGGELYYSIGYDEKNGLLKLRVKEAKNLITTIRGRTTTMNPTVKIYLSGEKRKQAMTKVKHKTNSPIFDETFIFNIQAEEMLDRAVIMRIYDQQVLSYQTFLGEVKIPLHTVVHGEGQLVKAPISTIIDMGPKGKAKLLLVLHSLPKSDKMEVVLVEAANLPKPPIGEQVYSIQMKLTINNNKQGLTQKRISSIKRKSSDIYYNETFKFDIPAADLPKSRLEITAYWHRGRFHKEAIGHISLHSQSVELERNHWKRFLTCPNRYVRQWHTLRSMTDE